MPGRAASPAPIAVVPGPGLLNTTAALATAYATNAPVLCISGQIPSDLIGRGFGLLHEIPDQLAILKGLTKWAARINHPSETGKLVNEAFRQLARRPAAPGRAGDAARRHGARDARSPCPRRRAAGRRRSPIPS